MELLNHFYPAIKNCDDPQKLADISFEVAVYSAKHPDKFPDIVKQLNQVSGAIQYRFKELLDIKYPLS